MICESCSENQATVHLTEITDSEKRELHLCETCAEQKGVSMKHPFAQPQPVSGSQSELKSIAALMCPQCGLSYAEFRAKGRLGCPNDYAFFHRGLEPLLERIHGHTGHVGKVPKRLVPSVELSQEITKLETQMAEAVQGEEYEQAAKLRDRIRDLKSRVEGKADGAR